jgi:cytochrome c peroxidase
VLLLLVGCNYYDWGGYDTDLGQDDGDPFFTREEWAKIQTHGPLPLVAPADSTNRYADDPGAAVLGQRLYFEKGFSGSWLISPEYDDMNCASCHEREGWFGAITTEADNWRNTPPVVNSAFYDWFLWDGGRDSMWAQSLGPPEAQMGSTRLRVVHVLFEKYRAEYDAVFEPKLPPELAPGHPEASRFPDEGGPGFNTNPNWDDMTAADQELVNQIYANFGKALAAYQRRLISGNSPFDQYVEGDFDILTESQKRGLRLFIGSAGCSECHAGKAFTDNDFHNIGMAGADDSEGRFLAIPEVLNDPFNTASLYSDADVGRLDGLEQTEADLGKFRTKHLRQIAETGQYMHAGQLATLRDVVDYYNDGGPTAVLFGELDDRIRPLGLNEGEVNDVVAFLKALTGDPISDELAADISYK